MTTTEHLRRLALAGIAGLTLLTGASCGTESTGSDTEASSSDKEKQTPSPSPTPTGLIRGTYAEQPGQVDDMQEALTGAGFECTTNAEPRMDLRMCSKGGEWEAQAFEPAGAVDAYVKFVADEKGTVVFAAFGHRGGSVLGGNAEEVWAPMRDEILQALLPETDAAIVVAGGGELEWGRYVEGQSDSGESHLIANGFEPRRVLPSAPVLSKQTKEQAFATLQAAELDCQFGHPMDFSDDTKDTTLYCTDPSFTSENEDGSIEGAISELTLRQSTGSAGIDTLLMQGRHASIPDDTRAIQTMLPKFREVDADPGVTAMADWFEEHLDGLPHSAYVGHHLVTISVVPESMTGDEVSAGAGPEQPALGLPADQGGIGTPTRHCPAHTESGRLPGCAALAE
jgi:hypothetical protein